MFAHSHLDLGQGINSTDQNFRNWDQNGFRYWHHQKWSSLIKNDETWWNNYGSIVAPQSFINFDHNVERLCEYGFGEKLLLPSNVWSASLNKSCNHMKFGSASQNRLERYLMFKSSFMLFTHVRRVPRILKNTSTHRKNFGGFQTFWPSSHSLCRHRLVPLPEPRPLKRLCSESEQWHKSRDSAANSSVETAKPEPQNGRNSRKTRHQRWCDL